MLRKVKIKSLPKARTGYQVQGALVNDVPAMGGMDYNAYIGMKKPKVRSSLTAVPREQANLEAEGGETVVGNIDGSGMPSFYDIEGPRHSNGGVPLSLPDDSFIFSDTQSMKIADPVILKMFNKPVKKGGYTPAELSKQYDLNKYRKILQDPESDKIARKTAELMLKNYTIKLGALALAQEGKKGFPQGIPAISVPYMEANGITEEQVMPELAMQKKQEEQMMQQQQQAAGEEPYIEPEAQEEMAVMEPGMSPDQMQMPEEAMMQMGGMMYSDYAFPYYPSEMAYGGYIPMAQGGGEFVVIDGKKVPANKVTKLEGEGTRTKTESGKEAIYRKQSAAERKETLGKAKGTGSGGTPSAAWTRTICDALKAGQTVESLAAKGHGTVAGLKSRFKDCIKTAEEKFQEKEEAFFVDQDPATEETVTRCECTRADGTTYDPGKNSDGSCKDCEETVVGGQQDFGVQTPPKPEAQWWLQDTVNTMGAFGNLMGLKKYMPWEARVDLEEPRPTFLDPTRELAAQSEQANIATQAAAQFAGPQALNARLSQIQGQGARGAADTLSRINNANVNIANQFEANQVGVRNQESQLNQAMTNRLYDKNVIANQQFDNAQRQARADMRQAYNTAVTNKWKTDALNQLYPNYQTLPGTGGRVVYTPTPKTVDPGAKQSTMGEQLKDLMSQGFSREAAEKYLLNQNKKKGGTVPGYIYTNWPIFL
jgi:hypothetical protein